MKERPLALPVFNKPKAAVWEVPIDVPPHARFEFPVLDELRMHIRRASALLKVLYGEEHTVPSTQSHRSGTKSRSMELQNAGDALIGIWADVSVSLSVEVFINNSPIILGDALLHRDQCSTIQYHSLPFRTGHVHRCAGNG